MMIFGVLSNLKWCAVSWFLLCIASFDAVATPQNPVDEALPGEIGFSLQQLREKLLAPLVSAEKKVSTAAVEWRNRRTIDQIATPEGLSFLYASTVRSIADSWLRRTEWAGRIRVNEPPAEQNVNLLLMKHDHLKLLKQASTCGCQYLPGTWTIICDEVFATSNIVCRDTTRSRVERYKSRN